MRQKLEIKEYWAVFVIDSKTPDKPVAFFLNELHAELYRDAMWDFAEVEIKKHE